MNALDSTAFDMTVVRRTEAADGVALIELEADRTLPRWQPGAHIDVILPNGDARQYSLCGTPGSPTWRIGVLREDAGRGGSTWIHDHALQGATLRVAGPRNHFEFS